MTAQDLFELLEAMWAEPFWYSGRGMLGKECPAFRVDEDELPFQAVARMLVENGDPDTNEQFSNALDTAKTDSLGYRTVIYFPRFTREDEE